MAAGKRKRKGKSRKPPAAKPSGSQSPERPDPSPPAAARPVAETTPSERRRLRREGADESLPLERERKLGRIIGLLGLGATLMTFVAVAFANKASTDGPKSIALFGSGDESDFSEAEELVDFARGGGDQLVAALLHSSSLLIAIPVGLFLFWMIQSRYPAIPPRLRWLTFAGPVLFAASVLVVHFALNDVADEFVASGPQTDDRAEDLRADSPLLLMGGALDLIGRIAFAAWLGMISREAMHVDLLTRFLGIFGIGSAFAIVLGALGIDIGLAMYIGWLASVAILALGWWPGGRPDGWTYRVERIF